MKKMILSYLLHFANRNIKSENEEYRNAFYRIKDELLKKYGTWVGYDVQHIKGKRCNSCGGTGQHARYSNTYPYKAYDWSDCYHCFAGWYKMPLWICLRRVQLGKFIFHVPLKREEHIGNPFTKESLGWEVTSNPVIEGYIDHDDHSLGGLSIYLILFLFGSPVASHYLKYKLYWRKVRIRNKISNALRWQSWILYKPMTRSQYFADNDDLPF